MPVCVSAAVDCRLRNTKRGPQKTAARAAAVCSFVKNDAGMENIDKMSCAL